MTQDHHIVLLISLKPSTTYQFSKCDHQQAGIVDMGTMQCSFKPKNKGEDLCEMEMPLLSNGIPHATNSGKFLPPPLQNMAANDNQPTAVF